MNQIFGDFIEEFPPDHDSLELVFTPTSDRIKNLWSNHRLSAHFLADYFSNFLPLDKAKPEEDQLIKNMKGTIGYMSNELLENAMKYNLDALNFKVKIGIHFVNSPNIVAVMFATNSIDGINARKLRTFIQKLFESDPEEFYMQQVLESAESKHSEASGLGFLSMINDYQAKLGWKFEQAQSDPEITIVTTMAQVSL